MVIGGRTHYERLGVPVDASTDEIRAAYRSLARVLHPDRSESAVDPKDMAALNEAWFVLRDRGRRAAYDRDNAVRSDPTETSTKASDGNSTPFTKIDDSSSRAFRRLVVTATVLLAVVAVVLTTIAIIGAGNRP